MNRQKTTVGVLGYGSLGRYLVEKVLASECLQLAFVWNRNPEKLKDFDSTLILSNISDISQRKADIVVEVAHPDITRDHGPAILENSDYMIGSPTALADPCVLADLERASASSHHGIYIPSGAFWGGEDIKKMADVGSLQTLKVTMKKHPESFKLEAPLKERNEDIFRSQGCGVLYDGSVRELCPLAPNNVNTMAAAAIAGHNLGFDNVQGCLVSDTKLTKAHVVEIEVRGRKGFHVQTLRTNPATPGAVTGQATYNAFFTSLAAAKGKGSGVHLC